jgi:hypothetical protein
VLLCATSDVLGISSMVLGMVVAIRGRHSAHERLSIQLVRTLYRREAVIQNRPPKIIHSD